MSDSTCSDATVAMNLVQTAPDRRLPNLLQDPERYGYANLMVNLPRYGCPHCGQFTVFSTDAVFSVDQPAASPIPEALLGAFDALTAQRSEYEQGVADFLCRGCSRPVRVVYRVVEFHMASYHYFAEAVIEIDAGSD